MIVEYSLPPEDIVGLFLIVGGDHRQGEFRLCFRALLTMRGRIELVYKTKSIAGCIARRRKGRFWTSRLFLG